MANPPARGVWVLTPVLHTAASKNAPSASAWGTHPTTKPHLKHLAANEKPLRSFTYRDCKTQPCGICKTATQFYIPLRRKMPTSASAWGIFLLAVAVVCGFRRCVRFSWGWGFKIFQDLCPLVIRKNSFDVPGHLSENL